MSFSHKWLWSLPVAAAIALGIGVDHLLSAAADAKQDLKPAITLPVTRVVLFNSGVGYFARSGEVDGDARIDLTFPETDVNDLLKSMVLQDFNGGRVAAVSYDSREPIARTLSSFAIDLNRDPSFGQIVQQARGERVEVTMVPTAANQPGRLVGVVVGVEKQTVAKIKDMVEVLEVECLNLWCAEGLRSVKLSEIQQLRFTNPVLESEFRRALEVLALAHDKEKKSVSLHFAGEGKRKVQVGYVIEAPIWKTSYRLVLTEKEKPYLQGWAMVENPTDEDWSGVKMALVSGRPISFRMDLYNPLYVRRPIVEPELFASLRPPTYGSPPPVPVLGTTAVTGLTSQQSIAYEPRVLDKVGGYAPDPYANRGPESKTPYGPLQGGEASKVAEKRKHAAELGRELAGKMDMAAVGSAATGISLGDSFQYAIDHPVSLARQKSSLIPIVNKDVNGSRVSIYNSSVQPKHPLLGLRFKNSSGMHLSQGPITVFEGSNYAGDTRVLDVQPGEERLISFAIDLGTEIIPQNGPGTSKLTRVKANKGIVTTVTKVREEKKYKVANRSRTDRVLLIEHPNRTNQQFKLVDTDKPAEETAEVFRFQMAMKAGEEKTFTVLEERDVSNQVVLSNSPDEQMRWVISLNEASPALKQKLSEALKLKGVWDGHRRELGQVHADLQRLNADQDRIRKNLRETPKEAEVYTTYLKKLSAQEKEIDSLTAKQKSLMQAEFAAKKAVEDFLAVLSD